MIVLRHVFHVFTVALAPCDVIRFIMCARRGLWEYKSILTDKNNTRFDVTRGLFIYSTDGGVNDVTFF